MHIEEHVSQVQSQLTAAAALGDDRTREIAAGLATAAAPAVRLAVLAAVSAAADEITAGLLDYPGSPAVGVSLDGDDIALDIRSTQTAETADEPDSGARHAEGDPTARISLRLTEALKADIDAAADRDGVSVNTWLVRVAAGAVRAGHFGAAVNGVFGPNGPFGGGGFGRPGGPGGGFGGGHGGPGFGSHGGRGGRGRPGGQHISGWVEG